MKVTFRERNGFREEEVRTMLAIYQAILQVYVGRIFGEESHHRFICHLRG